MLIIQSTEYFCRHIETLGTALTWFAFVCLRFAMLHLADHATTSPSHRDLLIWTYRSAGMARDRHFLGRKGQFVVDSIWGTIDEVIPGLQTLLHDENGRNSTQQRVGEVPLVHAQHHCAEPARDEEHTSFDSRFQWQQHVLPFGQRTIRSLEKWTQTSSDFSSAGSCQMIADAFEGSQSEGLERAESIDSGIGDTREISIEEMSPFIDPALIDPDLELCDTNFLPVAQVRSEEVFQARQTLLQRPVQCQ